MGVERPFYQQDGCLAWIGRAKRLETQSKRIEQMLGELELGGSYTGDGSPSQSES
ncbi:MAG: YdeI/OmpD-associated family protein [Acidimicrobiia bacterium]|nr:YdeI/OmpD-associated family protein [Acidimicrobiia bacterium]